LFDSFFPSTGVALGCGGKTETMVSAVGIPLLEKREKWGTLSSGGVRSGPPAKLVPAYANNRSR
jgi:hypothetical protein